MKLRTSEEITLKTASGPHKVPPGGIFKSGRSENIMNLLCEGRLEAVLDKDHTNSDEILELASNFKNKNTPLIIYSQFFDEAFYCASTWVAFNSGLKNEGAAVYTYDELQMLFSTEKDEQKIAHEVKKIFSGKILDVDEGGGADDCKK
tara:strand:+ start:1244 stop:1687 length:444 start_codon:yes stop_codon:yes gene_type:complete